MTLADFAQALDSIVATLRLDARHAVNTIGVLLDGRVACDPCYVASRHDWDRALPSIKNAKVGDIVRLEHLKCYVLRVAGDGLTQYDLPVDSGCLAIFDSDSDVALRVKICIGENI